MSEQRKWPRTGCFERCVVTPCAHGSPPLVSRVVDYSFSGLHIESDHPLRKGDAITITLEVQSPETHLTRMTKIPGAVRWCARNTGNFTALYSAGIEIPLASSPEA